MPIRCVFASLFFTQLCTKSSRVAHSEFLGLFFFFFFRYVPSLCFVDDVVFIIIYMFWEATLLWQYSHRALHKIHDYATKHLNRVKWFLIFFFFSSIVAIQRTPYVYVRWYSQFYKQQNNNQIDGNRTLKTTILHIANTVLRYIIGGYSNEKNQCFRNCGIFEESILWFQFVEWNSHQPF